MLRTINRVIMTLFPREWRKRAQHKRRSEAAKKAWSARKRKTDHQAALDRIEKCYQMADQDVKAIKESANV